MSELTSEFDDILNRALEKHVKKNTMQASAWRLNHHDEIGLYGNQFWLGVSQKVMKVIIDDIKKQFKDLKRQSGHEELKNVKVNFGWGVRGSWKK